MQTLIGPERVTLWLSAEETAAWAVRPGAAWPCSTLAGKRLFVELDRQGLCDVLVDGARPRIDGYELSVIVAEYLAAELPADHPCHFAAVGQFATTAVRN